MQPAFFDVHHKVRNTDAVASAAPLMREMAGLHRDGIILFGKAMDRTPTSEDVALMHLAIHGFELFTGGIDLILQGRFDVASYLYRGLKDTHDFALLVPGNPALASRLIDPDVEVRAGEERKRAVQALRAKDARAAAEWEAMFKSEGTEYQRLSHAGAVHFGMALTAPSEQGERFPVIGGLSDAEATATFARGFVRDEAALLLSLAVGWQERLPEWAAAVRTLIPRVSERLSSLGVGQEHV